MTLGQASRPEKPISGNNAVGPKIDFDSLASHHDCVTILFTDICGFTAMSKEVEAVQVMNFLNTLYSAYDHLVDKHGVYKLETVGDCYVVVGGLMQKDAEGFVAINRQSIDREAHAMAVLDFALDMMSMASTVVMPHNQQPVVVRCGIHSGPIVSGVVGHRMPKFCCFGDTMNVASRMESTCAKGGIQVSSDTYALLAKHPRVGQLSHSGGVDVKGKGRMAKAGW
ncbi:guanylate cyclase domain-containing protein [Haematococcus lacustris]|uniref:Guanylate cyclase domain-containing protein n=1 Tax=Haematococcus lacustris TaxID=44745 RepID=A0A6A0AAL0_HAELA|nr:guanylate cyclase domain-containing protein [Haematococcus lacustris]